MTIVPIDYFDPKNGQATNLTQRVAELFKTDKSIRVSELNKVYDETEITALEADVTMFFDKKKIHGTTNICRTEFPDNQSFQKTITSVFNAFVPPIRITFDNKEQLDSYVQYIIDCNKEKETRKRADAYLGKAYVCKRKGDGLALNLHPFEIKATKTDAFPITLQFQAEEQLNDFVLDYAGIYYVDNTPIKKEASSQETSKKFMTVSIICACVAACLVFLLLITFSSSNEKTEVTVQSEHTSMEDRLPDWVYGTWSCTTQYGTETIKIDRNGDISDLSYGNYKTASYRYENGYIKAKFPGEGGIVTTFRVDLSGRRIEYGEGIYMHKR